MVAGKVIAEIGLVARLGLLATQVVRVRSTAMQLLQQIISGRTALRVGDKVVVNKWSQ